ncbi:hypothetical protein M3Y94_00533900 [Aphelenchoides besseyi]|nr:hypothetical protein M3Y94_00533900 [Aphelenchoides besseyi]KAI6225832.1 hypothetical protein M3Y95_00738600 [Aphelenchoides besseyi]
MTADPVQSFNKMLFAIKHAKYVSKDKMSELTKQAMSCIKHYKHVVFGVEKFIAKCDSKFKVAGFYVIDSIVRQGIKKFKEKDVFGPRFAKNLQTTLENALAECSEDDKLKIVRVLNLWKTNNVFAPELIDDLLNYCKQKQLDVDIETVEMKVKGDEANMSIYSSDKPKKKKATPRTPPQPGRSLNESLTSQASRDSLSDVPQPDRLSERELAAHLRNYFPHWASTFEKDLTSFRKFCDLFNEQLKDRVIRERAADGANISSILSENFEYSDDEDQDDKKPTKSQAEPLAHDLVERLALEVFTDGEFRNQLESLYAKLNIPLPPSNPANSQNLNALLSQQAEAQSNPWANTAGAPLYANSYAPVPHQAPAVGQSLNGNSDNRNDWDSKNRKRGRSRSPSRSSDPRKRKSHRSRRSRSNSDSDREQERERRRIGLPSHPRHDHVVLGSRTLWFGRLPQICTEQEIRDAVKDYAPSPERINIIPSRACCYVTFSQRRAAFKIIDRYCKDIRVNGRNIKVDWAHGSGFSKGDRLLEYWNSDRGYMEIPYSKLPSDLTKILEGSHLDVSTLPPEMKGKYDETGPVAGAFEQNDQNKSDEIPLSLIPTPGQLPTDLPPFPQQQQQLPSIPDPSTNIAQTGLPPINLAGSGLIDPTMFLAVLQNQQRQQQMNNLLSAFQQQNSALLPTPPSNSAPMSFNPATQLSASNDDLTHLTPDQHFQTPVASRGTFFGRPRFNGAQSTGFRPRGRGRGRGGAFQPRTGFPRFDQYPNPMALSSNNFSVPPPNNFQIDQTEDMDESQ